MDALICCECGVCELYACPMGLSPKTMNSYVKDMLSNKGIRYQKEQGETIAKEIREYRKIPVDRLISRLGLIKYKGKEMDQAILVRSSRVCIPLRQHIGKAATPIVAVGDRVSKGQLIGEVQMGELGANIHSSIDGKVSEIAEFIAIESENNEVIL